METAETGAQVALDSPVLQPVPIAGGITKAHGSIIGPSSLPPGAKLEKGLDGSGLIGPGVLFPPRGGGILGREGGLPE
ncbi:MAG: hypothetical protein Kow001_13150 [Acidobacteriota bacterium]